jgi:hypothetical protein
VQVTAPALLLGGIATVTITEIARNSLFGALAPDAQMRAPEPALLPAGA